MDLLIATFTSSAILISIGILTCYPYILKDFKALKYGKEYEVSIDEWEDDGPIKIAYFMLNNQKMCVQLNTGFALEPKKGSKVRVKIYEDYVTCDSLGEINDY